jgi:hypothetical protein
MVARRSNRSRHQEDDPVTVPSRYLLATAFGLWLAHPTLAKEPPRYKDVSAAPSANQQTADAIAARLRQSATLRGFTIDVTYQGGTAELSGAVADVGQRDEAVRLVAGVAGVDHVMSRLSVKGDEAVLRVQAPIPPPRELPPIPAVVAPGGPEPIGIPAGPAGSAIAGISDVNPPPLPAYAWPTYAPYNNYSRVAYPEVYPPQAWPFVGPFYPFPKVPLGWRSVKLEWEDGHWYFSKVANSHDFWRVRYW